MGCNTGIFLRKPGVKIIKQYSTVGYEMFLGDETQSVSIEYTKGVKQWMPQNDTPLSSVAW
jgi:hypothetical protein